MKLLVPVDGSPASLNAVKKSIEIAKKYGFAIKIITSVDFENVPGYRRNKSLLHQVEGPIITSDYMIADDDEIEVKMKENAASLLDLIVEKFDFSGIEVEKELLEGEPYVKILEQAKDGDFDLIVMGNRGFSKIVRFFVGSVTQKVISEAPCPVLVIPAEAEA
ncbi:universal stress protein [Anaerobium acetethylicum]|uniref:Nucleotide-binding universal stress protein, UspA family n=1 Tax=Anaerobium acetethylicum TaxID=1619234 RepID=A0A1D3TYC2_9FIRM|nr:universal stress protein [Anaerobium acetethylicum]SCP99433.1 Nucleotide-binding universal stress protein, UspA family [Anaerobium acetethylicum]